MLNTASLRRKHNTRSRRRESFATDRSIRLHNIRSMLILNLSFRGIYPPAGRRPRAAHVFGIPTAKTRLICASERKGLSRRHALLCGIRPAPFLFSGRRLFFFSAGKSAPVVLSRPVRKGHMEETRLGTVGIVVEDMEASAAINTILHQHADIIVGRLGIPYRSRGVAIIALAVDGSMEEISAMTGKLGKISGVSVKSAIAKQ